MTLADTITAIGAMTSRVHSVLVAAEQAGLDPAACSIQINPVGVELHASTAPNTPAGITHAPRLFAALNGTPRDPHYLMTHDDGVHAWTTSGDVQYPDGRGHLRVYTNGPCPDQR